MLTKKGSIKIFVIIQARMTSSRLPGKIMLPVGNKTALEMMIGRLGPLMPECDFIIATTNDGSEAPIVAVCEKLGLKYYRGDTDDVLSRYCGAAVKYGASGGDVIVRLTSDCPLIDPEITARTIQYFLDNSFDYVSNVVERTYPRGFDTQVVSFENLMLCQKLSETPYERDHVTTYIDTTHSGEFNIGSVKDTQDNSRYRITLDEESDYKAICEIYKKFDFRTDFTYRELLSLLNENQYIYEMNKRVEQKK